MILDISIHWEPYDDKVPCTACNELILTGGMIQVWQFGKGLEMEVIIPKTPVILCVPCYTKQCQAE